MACGRAPRSTSSGSPDFVSIPSWYLVATDLLIGIGAGVTVTILLRVFSGALPRSLVRATLDVVDDSQTCMVEIREAAIFSDWIGLENKLATLDADRYVVIDLSGTRIVDHTVMTKVEELRRDVEGRGHTHKTFGLDRHRPRSNYPHATICRAAANQRSKTA